MAEPSDPPADDNRARRVGRGALLITAGKGWFMLTATAVNLGLASLLGARDYGDYGVTTRWVALLNMMVVQGMLQGMSRAVSAQPASAAALRVQALRPVGLVALACGVFLVAASGPLAGLLGDERLAPLLVTCALITPAYAFYAAFVGVLNGRQAFARQAMADMGFSTAKLVFILGAAALGLGGRGGVAGFGVAAILMAAVAWRLSRSDDDAPPAQPITVRSLLSFSGVVMAYQALLNLQMFIDLGVVRRAVGTGALPSDAAGHYAGAVNMAQIPYMACTAITFVVFPLLGAAGAQPAEETRALARRATRYALLVAMPPAVALVAAAPGILGAVFPAEYVAVAGALRLLALSYVAAALAAVTCTMLNALGRPQLSVAAVALGAVVTAGLALALVESLGTVGTATASLCGMVTTLAFSLGALGLTGRGAFAWSSLARHLVVAVVVASAGWLVPWPVGGAVSRLVGFGGAAGMGLLALLLLWVVREIGPADVATVRGILGRRRAGGT